MNKQRFCWQRVPTDSQQTCEKCVKPKFCYCKVLKTPKRLLLLTAKLLHRHYQRSGRYICETCQSDNQRKENRACYSLWRGLFHHFMHHYYHLRLQTLLRGYYLLINKKRSLLCTPFQRTWLLAGTGTCTRKNVTALKKEEASCSRSRAQQRYLYL